jgi:hypothetical protein
MKRLPCDVQTTQTKEDIPTKMVGTDGSNSSQRNEERPIASFDIAWERD